MANFTEDTIKDAFSPFLEKGETIEHVAFGVKQPNILIIVLLVLLAIIPGIIATFLMTKNYFVATTNKRLLVLHIKGLSNLKVKESISYKFNELTKDVVKTSTGSIFTHIRISITQKPFIAKFHRAYSKFNRPNAMAICQTIS